MAVEPKIEVAQAPKPSSQSLETELQSKPSYPIPLRRTKNVWVMRDYGRTESAYMRA